MYLNSLIQPVLHMGYIPYGDVGSNVLSRSIFYEKFHMHNAIIMSALIINDKNINIRTEPSISDPKINPISVLINFSPNSNQYCHMKSNTPFRFSLPFPSSPYGRW